MTNASSQSIRVPARYTWRWVARVMAASVLAALLLQPAWVAAGIPPDDTTSGPVTTNPVTSNSATPEPAIVDPVMKVMTGELKRATADLEKADPAPYYLSYTVYEQNSIVLVA